MNDLTKSQDFIHNSEVTAFKWSKIEIPGSTDLSNATLQYFEP